MIADINESGLLSIKTETESESNKLKIWVKDNAMLSQSFTDCCNNKKCAFKFDLKTRMIEQRCIICGQDFQGTEEIEICPKCYV